MLDTTNSIMAPGNIYDVGKDGCAEKRKQHSTAARNTSYLTQDIGMPKASDAVVGT